jgi:hypothetical protein
LAINAKYLITQQINVCIAGKSIKNKHFHPCVFFTVLAWLLEWCTFVSNGGKVKSLFEKGSQFDHPIFKVNLVLKPLCIELGFSTIISHVEGGAVAVSRL